LGVTRIWKESFKVIGQQLVGAVFIDCTAEVDQEKP
jgi:hypothetical protein